MSAAPRFAPIAIVGRACVLPGALSPAQLWAVAAEGRDMISSVDAGRWRAAASDVLCEPDQPKLDHAWTDRGGYVRGFEAIWQPEGFGVEAAELAGLDRLCHWVLHCAREALADAGDDRRGVVARPRVGAVFGNLGFPSAEMTRYAETLWLQGLGGDARLPDPRNRFMFSGAAALLERALGLAPGVMCLDTACASSLYAIELACRQLHVGRVDLALAGAVNAADDLFLHVGFSALSALSRSGRSRPFHAEADGLLPAEGCGFVTLERLDDARRNGRHIHGIIRGVGLSNDGRGRGMLAPSEHGQRRALRQAYACAGVDPSAVSLLECHATGTTLGDATELRSSAEVFARSGDELAISSLKSNIGHAITAAGVAGLIKVLEAMAHGQRAPSLHAERRSPVLAEGPFRVIDTLEPWPAEGPRIAGISAFGFGGNNAHLIVSEDDPGLAASALERVVDEPLAVVGIGLNIGPAQGVAAVERALLSGASMVVDGQCRAETVELELVGLRFPPNDLRHTLAQQLTLLAAAREATGREATRREELERERTGVFVGMEPDPEICRQGVRGRLASRLREAGGDAAAEREWIDRTRDAIAAPLEAARVVGTMPNIPANRINAQLDLGGPSWTVAAGEASGRVTLELARAALRRRELDVAIVGAVDLSCQDVHCAALEAIEGRAQVPGDAAVVLVLRRLDDARARGDELLGVIEAAPEPGAKAPEAPELGSFGLDARFGRSWAAGGLRDVAAALISGRRGARPDASPWPQGVAGRVRLASAAVGLDDLMLRPVSARPSIVGFAGVDEADLDAALARARIGVDGPCRAIVLASGPAQLDARVARARRHLREGGATGPGVFVRKAPVRGQLALVFSGAGSAYAGMGADLYAALPQLGQAVAAASPELARYAEQPWPRDEAAVPPLQRLWASSFLSQVHARLATELLGLQPDALIGYSSGESNALFAVGVWTECDAMVAACRDSGVFTEAIGGELRVLAEAWDTPTPGWDTWIVLAPVDDVAAAVEPEARAHLSIIHHDREVVVAGEPAACARVRERVGGRWLRLHYDLVVHVPELAAIAERWLELHRWPVTPPRDALRIYSGAHGGAYAPTTEACAAAILGQADRRLDFRRVIEQAWTDGVRVFVEMGPQAACSRWIAEILGPRAAAAVIVGFDRRRGGVEAVLEAVAALTAAGVPCHGERLLAALEPGAPSAAGEAARLRLPAHPEPVRLPPRASIPSNASPTMNTPPMQSMPPAPKLPSVDASAPALSSPALVPNDPRGGASERPAATPTVTATARVASSATPSANPLAAAVEAQLAELGRLHRELATQQLALHEQFLAVHEQSMATLAAAARGRGVAQTFAPTPASSPSLPAPAPAPTRARTSEPPSTPSVSAPSPVEPSRTEPEPRPAPRTVEPVEPSPRAAVDTPAPRAPVGPSFTREQLEIHSSGRISEIFGPLFEVQDGFERQVRMPEPPLLLADRVIGLDAEPMSMKLGTIWTETDVRADSWFVHQGRIPAGIMIEAGQADLMLISYLGVDAHNRGERVYRLLGCVLTYHESLPEIGDTLRYDIHLDGHAKTGATRLMFFHYDCHVGDRRVLSVRGGQAGFFTAEELANSEGCLWRPEDQDIVALADEGGPGRLDRPAVACEHRSFSAAQVLAFADGRPWDCFGPADGRRSVWDRARPHTRTPQVASGDMLLFEAVERFDVAGGPWGRGYLSVTLEIHPERWFFDGHFHNDPCMPGTLMFEGCFQAMAFYLAALGHTLERDGWRFEPVTDEAYALSCRGQVLPSSKMLICEVFVEEIIAGPEPTIFADVLGTVDGLKAFHGRRIGLRLVPAWPLDTGHPLLDDYAGEPLPVARISDPAGVQPDLPLGLPSLLACAQGRPSAAFGPLYARFDGPEPVARLPNPPYHFISRVIRVEGVQGSMKPGGVVEFEYDIPAHAWYLAENGCRVMPFAVLLEAALQPCGWLASYMGCALSTDIPLKFRNLDGTGTVHAELPEDAGTLRTRVVNETLSKTATMIIVGFSLECHVGEQLVYSLETVFGFFPAAAFENQAGLPTTPEQRALLEAPSEFRRELGAASGPRPGRAQLARPRLLMLDHVTAFDPEGGAAGLGFARAEKDVNPGEWFFAAHFFQDPVQPGSLGIEAMIQLLQWTMVELGMDADMGTPRFEAIAVGEPMTWKYRGQVVPQNHVISTTLELSARGTDERGAWARADVSLWVDGKRIYEAQGLAMRIVDDALGGQGAHGDLELGAVRRFWTEWIGRSSWPGEDIHYGLLERFVGRVVVEDPDALAAVAGRGAVFVANHQVAIESLAFAILAPALIGVRTVALAKIEHKHTWLGKLAQLCVNYPDVRDPGLLTYIDRADKQGVMRAVAELVTVMREQGTAILVHIEGTRSRGCRTPVRRMSGAFIDLAISVGAPIIPVRFTGGLPGEPLAQRLEFPLGLGRQDIWVGRPLLPAELGAEPLGERKRRVIEGVNELGPRNGEELPNPGDPALAARVARWQAERSVSYEHAVLREVLRERAEPCEAIARLLAADGLSALETDESDEGRWLVELGRRLGY